MSKDGDTTVFSREGKGASSWIVSGEGVPESSGLKMSCEITEDVVTSLETSQLASVGSNVPESTSAPGTKTSRDDSKFAWLSATASASNCELTA